jgi:type I restriction enzyme R subunit
MSRLIEIKKEVDQIIDIVSIDVVEEAGYSKISTEKARKTVESFREFIKQNRSELRAIEIFYNHKGSLKWKDLKELSKKITTPPYVLTTAKLWYAYKKLSEEKVKGVPNNKRISDFISLLKYEIEKTPELEPYLDTVDKRFAEWLGRQKEQGAEFNQEQLNWLEKIKQHIATTTEIEADDFELGDLQKMGGLGNAVKVFGQEKFNEILVELNNKVGGYDGVA